ncbi:unnamed protein product [Diamesa hyperborea]
MNWRIRDGQKAQFEDRQKFIKQSLTFNLSENVKECEYQFETDKKPLVLCDPTSSLCSTLEAIFLHGLKDSFLQFTISILRDNETETKPSPNFWNIIILFLHKQVIEDIQSFTQITTEVGYSRAFIRMALNESSFSAYIQNIRKHPALLKKSYHQYALLFDTDLLEMTENLLLGIESFVQFDLPCNSSLLNVWNDTPLQMAGIYSIPLRSIPIASGEDVAGSITNTSQSISIPKNISVLSDIYSASIGNSIFTNSPNSILDADDDERVTRLLRAVDSDDVEVAAEELEIPKEINESSNEEVLKTEEENPMTESFNESVMTESAIMGNSLSGRQSWSEPGQVEPENSVEEEEVERQEVVFKRFSSVSSVSSAKSAVPDNISYNALWNDKSKKTSNFKEVWERFEKTLQIESESIEENAQEDEMDETGFEIVKSPTLDKLSMQELQIMVEILCRLTTECGLDSQGFLCKNVECRSPLGVDFSKATVCAFDSHYYCNSCISPDKYPIPARIIYNFDFKAYPVNLKAATFLSEFQFKPFIDFKLLNPEIYTYIDPMNRLQKLRIQLNFLRAYIFTCSDTIVNELRKKLYGKEYMYDKIHHYSISDLTLINNGALEEMLKKIVAFGKGHCLNCALCSVKGFICELCRKPKVIYPFDIDDTFRCNDCGAVFHINCYNPSIPCPKCERKQKRLMITADE